MRVPALLRALDIFVLASKFEPYGVALLEARCAGCAIVSTSVNEIPKILGYGVRAGSLGQARPDEVEFLKWLRAGGHCSWAPASTSIRP